MISSTACNYKHIVYSYTWYHLQHSNMCLCLYSIGTYIYILFSRQPKKRKWHENTSDSLLFGVSSSVHSHFLSANTTWRISYNQWNPKQDMCFRFQHVLLSSLTSSGNRGQHSLISQEHPITLRLHRNTIWESISSRLHSMPMTMADDQFVTSRGCASICFFWPKVLLTASSVAKSFSSAECSCHGFSRHQERTKSMGLFQTENWCWTINKLEFVAYLLIWGSL